MHGLSKVMQESNIKWINVANEMVAVRKLLAEIETNDIIESAKIFMSCHAMLLGELERRFSNENIEVLGVLEALDASKSTYLDYKTLAPFVANMTIDDGLLKTECERAKFLIAAGKNIDLALYPNLLKVIDISKTLPVGTATVERSFSAMNRILSWARNNLDSSWASDFMLLSMNKDLLKSINRDEVLDRWVHQKNRIVPFN